MDTGADPLVDAHGILEALQAAVDSGDVDTLSSLFDDSAVLIGTVGDGRDREGVVRYLTAVATQEERFRWERDVVVFHRDAATIGFAAFGDVVAGEQRAPIRLTVLAVRTPEGWRLRQFHGSIPAGL